MRLFFLQVEIEAGNAPRGGRVSKGGGGGVVWCCIAVCCVSGVKKACESDFQCRRFEIAELRPEQQSGQATN
jgi:hypothetical protein